MERRKDELLIATRTHALGGSGRSVWHSTFGSIWQCDKPSRLVSVSQNAIFGWVRAVIRLCDESGEARGCVRSVGSDAGTWARMLCALTSWLPHLRRARRRLRSRRQQLFRLRNLLAVARMARTHSTASAGRPGEDCDAIGIALLSTTLLVYAATSA